MPKEIELPHYRQILTTKRTIIRYMRNYSGSIGEGILYCIVKGPEEPEYLPVLHAACLKLWFLSKLVYRGKGGIVKLPVERYQRGLFDHSMETIEEVAEQLRRLHLEKDYAAYAYKCLQPIKKLLCNMIACTDEQPFVSELAYAVDYVIQRNGDVAEPSFEGRCHAALFPTNYSDFHYNEGIAEDIERIDMF